MTGSPSWQTWIERVLLFLMVTRRIVFFPRASKEDLSLTKSFIFLMDWAYLYCKNMNDSLFTRGFWVIIIRLYRRDGRVVQGVALELLCRLFVYRGFESLSFRIFTKFINITHPNVYHYFKFVCWYGQLSIPHFSVIQKIVDNGWVRNKNFRISMSMIYE